MATQPEHVETFKQEASEAAVIADIRHMLGRIERRGFANRGEKKRLEELRAQLAVIRKGGDA